MSSYSMRLHDVGEGVAEAEIVEWRVQIGDTVTSDDIIAEVMSDKATIELYSPVDGTVTWQAGEAGDIVAVGAELIRFDVNGEMNASGDAPGSQAGSGSAGSLSSPSSTLISASGDARGDSPTQAAVTSEPANDRPAAQVAPAPPPRRTLAAPAVRTRAATLGVDLAGVPGTGPEGRVVHADLDELIGSTPRSQPREPDASEPDEIEAVKVTGLRRNIAERMQAAKRRIPHFTYVEEVDVTELERLRQQLNDAEPDRRTKLNVLPFIMRAVVRAVRDHPEMNARFDDEAGVVNRHRAVHLGIAVQTERGLMVPVVRSAGSLDLWGSADAIIRLSASARSGKIKLDELTGSTITITSLGALGGVVSTPVINAPEVAIIGVNKIATRPVYIDGVLMPRQMMNLSSSFDHRIIDGVNAAEFVQDIKRYLETPALLWTG